MKSRFDIRSHLLPAAAWPGCHVTGREAHSPPTRPSGNPACGKSTRTWKACPAWAPSSSVSTRTPTASCSSVPRRKTRLQRDGYQKQGNKFTMHSVCKFENTTATTDAVFTGAFDSSYKGDMRTRYSPPMHGMSESKMSMEAKWLGPCKAGQKPGDVIMPNMKGINMNEMMNDPKFQEMMKRQK